MLKIKTTKQFDKDYKLARKRGYKLKRLTKVLEILAAGDELPAKYRDHMFKNTPEYRGVRECHIQPDWLLVYRVEEDIEILRLIRTGTHSDLF